MPDPQRIAVLRRDYTLSGLRRADLEADPLAQFHKWFEQAIAAGLPEPNAMTLSTVNAEGIPSARIVLLKNLSPAGFTFFTNYDSRKGRELAANPHAALVFFWPQLERQVCIAGSVTKTSRAESEKYFNSRPRESRLAAWVSNQSEPIISRDALEKKLDAIRMSHPDEQVPLPSYWGGFNLAPVRIEFWQGRPNRLHDRFCYLRRADQSWVIDRLSP